MIKNSKYNLITKFFYIAFCLLLVLIIVPAQIIKSDIGNILNATALLYSILIGFLVTAAMNNYFELQRLVTNETGNLINLFSLVKLIDKRKVKSIIDKIDKYLIKGFDYDLTNYTDKTAQEFNELIQTASSVKVINQKETQTFNIMMSNISDMRKTRQQIRIVAPKIITSVYWTTLLTLASIIIGLLFLTCDEGFVEKLVTLLLSFSVVISLLLLAEVDSNRLDEEKLAFETFENVFDIIGRPRYYPSISLKAGRIKLNFKKDYRVGFYKNYPKDLTKEIVNFKSGKKWQDYKKYKNK
ncbi:MAG: hypothetical protein PHS07_04095 [Patescibacteria group bacterium]|nr:hypothetical protein [Patescibacteria group bacterium]